MIIGEPEQLQVTVEGTGRVESCIGENITFTCNGLGLAHTWTAPGLLHSTRLIYSFPDVVTSRYTLRSLALDGTVFTSSFMVISDAEFNNTNVTCRDTVGGVQHRIAVVLGEILCEYVPSFQIGHVKRVFISVLFKSVYVARHEWYNYYILKN